MRRRILWLLLGTLLAAVLALGVLAWVLLGDVAETALAAATSDQAQALRARLDAAAVTLWLGAAAVLAFALALGLAALRLVVVRPLETLVRDLAQDPALPPTAGLEELDRLAAALAHYRRLTVRDQAERTSHLDAVGALRGAADAALQQLAESDRLALVGRVSLGVAHEVGGPLAVVSGHLERLRQLEAEGAPAAERLASIDKAAAAAERIATILADLSQPGLPRPRDADRPCDLVAVALRTVQLAEDHPRGRGLQLDVQAADGTHPADASASHVEQVLLNLVLNAADATGGRGRVVLGLRRDGDWQELCVDDDGPGIAAADLEQVFAPFFSTKTGAGPGRAGWGLGLAVSRRVVLGYGGSLHAAASPLGGARFVLRLPVPARWRQGSRTVAGSGPQAPEPTAGGPVAAAARL